MAGTIKRTFGPLALTTTLTTNVYNFTLYLGATGANAAGTELFFQFPVAAKQSYDYYAAMKMTSTEFLVGGAATTLTLVIEAEGEQYVV